MSDCYIFKLDEAIELVLLGQFKIKISVGDVDY